MKNALAGLVPTSRTVNGKTLSADVTLGAEDIKLTDDSTSAKFVLGVEDGKLYIKETT